MAQARAQLDQAVAQHTRADQDFQRAQALYATQSLTKPDYDQSQEAFREAQATVENATAALRQADLTLLDADLKAPFPGYILSRKIELRNAWCLHRRLRLRLADISSGEGDLWDSRLRSPKGSSGSGNQD